MRNAFSTNWFGRSKDCQGGLFKVNEQLGDVCLGQLGSVGVSRGRSGYLGSSRSNCGSTTFKWDQKEPGQIRGQVRSGRKYICSWQVQCLERLRV